MRNPILPLLLLPLALSTVVGQTPFYEATVIANPASSTPQGNLSDYKLEASVNEKGQVAFVGYYGSINNVIVGDGRNALVDITRSPSGNHFFPQINNQSQVVWRELLSGNGLVSLGSVNNPGAPSIIASTTLSAFSRLTQTTITNTKQAPDQPTVGFLGAVDNQPFAFFANNTGVRNQQVQVSGLSATLLRRFQARSAAAEHRRHVMLFEDSGGTSRLAVYTDVDDNMSYNSSAIASTRNNWTELGSSPAISDSGRVVAFTGTHATDGEGLYIAVLDGSAPSAVTPIKVLTTDNVFAYDGQADPIKFSDFNGDHAVGVLHQERGPAGMSNDVITITFVATPSSASRPNPHAGGKPLLFSGQEGIWTVRVDVEAELSGSSLVYRPRSPIPVIQKMGKVAGVEVQGFTLYDPLSLPLVDRNGVARVPRPGDHYLACGITTGIGNWIVRFSHFDTDLDGLLDHWETDGIDMDCDGTPDLALSAFGADPLRADLFVEMDWTNPKAGAEGWLNEPAPLVTHNLAAMFASAPIVNPNNTTGVTVHVDAGPGDDLLGMPFSVNLPPTATLDGGELIGTAADPNAHLDRIYFGVAETTTVNGVNSRDMTSIKDTYFGDRDKGARELAFKYLAAADWHSFQLVSGGKPWVGRVVSSTSNIVTGASNLDAHNLNRQEIKIVQGTGAGQVRCIADHLDVRIAVRTPWSVTPDATSRFVIFNSSSGLAEVFFQPMPDYNSFPGNDFLLTMRGWGVNGNRTVANPALQWRTIAHELGHTLSLRHGGTDHMSQKGPNYLSIMSYSYQTATGSGVNSYSTAGDPTYDDWSHLKMDFFRSFFFLGNTYKKGPFGDFENDYPEITLQDYVEIHGEMPDLEPPTVAITVPGPGAEFAPGQDLAVTVTATDNKGVEEVVLLFDVDGDGARGEEGEYLVGVPQGGDTYAATFRNVRGPRGAREILVLVADAEENRSAARLGVVAGQASGIGQVLHSSNNSLPAAGPGGDPQRVDLPGIAVPGSGRVLLSVTGTPAIRQAGTDTPQADAAILRIVFEGEVITLEAVCTAPGISPSLCSTYWNAPSAGTLDVTVTGPRLYDGDGNLLATPSQDVAIHILFDPVDLTAPDIEVSPVTLAFGNVEVGQSSQLQLTLRNNGPVDLSVTGLSLDDARFSASATLPISIGEGAQRVVDVTFNPSAEGLRSGTLTVQSNDPDEPTVTVSFSGTGVLTGPSAPVINSISPTEANIGAVVILDGEHFGNTVGENVVRFGGVEAQLSSATGTRIEAVVPAGVQGAVQVTVTAGGMTSAGYPFTVTVPPAVPDIEVSPVTLAFGNVEVGQSSQLQLTIRNTGPGDLSITGLSSDDARFAVSATLPMSIGEGAQRVVNVTFNPLAEGARSGTLTVQSNDPDEPTVTVSLTGTGVTEPTSTVIYETDFSSFPLGNDTLAGTDGWDSSPRGEGTHGTMQIAGIFPAPGPVGFIGFNAPSDDQAAVWRNLNRDPLAENLPMVEFSVDLAIFDSTIDCYDVFALSFYNQAGQPLASVVFDNASLSILVSDQNDVVDTGQAFENDVAFTLSGVIDFASNTWSVDMVSQSPDSHHVPLFSGLPFHGGGMDLTLGSIDFSWHIIDSDCPGDNALLFDKVSVSMASDSGPPPAIAISGFELSEDRTSAHVTWPAEAGKTYRVEYTINLRDWLSGLPGSTFPTNAGEVEHTFTVDAESNFRCFRIISD